MQPGTDYDVLHAGLCHYDNEKQLNELDKAHRRINTSGVSCSYTRSKLYPCHTGCGVSRGLT